MTDEFTGLVLSPSKISTFTQCPLRYKYRYIDRREEPQSEEAARGSRVHNVFEELYRLPAPERTLEAVLALLTDPDDRAMAEGLFALEDPRRVPAVALERDVWIQPRDDVKLHGIIDRLDRLPAGYGITDYKTGKVPEERYEGKAIWQLKFYGLLWWRYSKQLPAAVQLLYIAARDRLWQPLTEPDLINVEKRALSIADTIIRAIEKDDFRPSKSKLCDYCSFKPECPAWQ